VTSLNRIYFQYPDSADSGAHSLAVVGVVGTGRTG
jgi:hypothetical protein